MRNAIRRSNPLLLVLAAFVAAGGFIHLREWLDTYRNVPAAAPGSAVVRIGFPVNAGLSLALALAIVASVLFVRSPRFAAAVVVVTGGFEAASLATLILSRTGSVFGWSEPVWTTGADQSRAVEIGALVVVVAALAYGFVGRKKGFQMSPLLSRTSSSAG
jgi:hypothetical protein